MRYWKPIYIVLLLFIILITGCNSSTGPKPIELTDGRFLASVEGSDAFTGDAFFEISVPENEWFPGEYEDPVLFLRLVTEELKPANRPVEYVILVGILVNVLWDEESQALEIGNTVISNTFIDPRTYAMHDIKSGTIRLTERTDGLLAGTVELIIENSAGVEKELTGEFRAVPEEQQGT
ncbi:MAG: hypothetical protein ACNA8K_10260 [Cyclonatronaceae bacterium]